VVAYCGYALIYPGRAQEPAGADVLL